MPDPTATTDSLAAFGPNEWFVDELYEQYLADRNSVDHAWWDFFADYRPSTRTVTKPAAAAAVAPSAAEPAPTPAPTPTLAPTPAPTAPAPSAPPDGTVTVLRGPAARVVTNM